MRILIQDGTVIPLAGTQAVIDSCNLYVQDGLIAGIGDAPQPFPVSSADKVIDARGCIVLPGFVNAHGHLNLGIHRGLCEFVPGTTWASAQRRLAAFGEGLTEEDLHDGALLCMAEMIRSGTTTFHHEGPLIAEAVEQSGLRACLSFEIQGYVTTQKHPTVRLTYRQEKAQRTLARSRSAAELWDGRASGRIKSMLGIACPPVPPFELLQQVARAAKQTGLSISMHIAEIALEMEEWEQRFGSVPAKVLRRAGVLDNHVVGGNCVFLTPEDARILRDFDFHATTCPQNCCKLSLGMLDVPMLLEHEVNVALGTNEAMSNNNLDMIEEMRMAALYHKLSTGDRGCLSGDIPLRLITENGGRALGFNGGTLEVGRCADITIMDASGPHMIPRHDIVANVIYASAAADVRTVLVDGRVVMEDHRILTFDEDAVISRLEARLAPLRRDLPPLEPGDTSSSTALEWFVD